MKQKAAKKKGGGIPTQLEVEIKKRKGKNKGRYHTVRKPGPKTVGEGRIEGRGAEQKMVLRVGGGFSSYEAITGSGVLGFREIKRPGKSRHAWAEGRGKGTSYAAEDGPSED